MCDHRPCPSHGNGMDGMVWGCWCGAVYLKSGLDEIKGARTWDEYPDAEFVSGRSPTEAAIRVLAGL